VIQHAAAAIEPPQHTADDQPPTVGDGGDQESEQHGQDKADQRANDEYTPLEAVKADLRHYLKRLARKSRCFSRSLEALHKNVRLSVFCYKQRQNMEHLYPKYSFQLIDFLYPVC